MTDKPTELATIKPSEHVELIMLRIRNHVQPHVYGTRPMRVPTNADDYEAWEGPDHEKREYVEYAVLAELNRLKEYLESRGE